MEILKTTDFDEKKIFELEMHSFLNVLSVVTGMLQVVQMDMKQPELLADLVKRGFSMAKAIQTGDKVLFNSANLIILKNDLLEALNNLHVHEPAFAATSEFADHMGIFEDIFSVLDVRVSELQIREQNPDKWENFTIDEFKADFRKFFYAMEQSSKGRYHIVYNVAQQEEIDYLVHFEVNSDLHGRIIMPLLLKDVIRDLIANARKYTPPGGDITIGVAMDNKKLRFIVEDTGMGIPADEIENVVDFGYRAGNVIDKVRTMGGGFGLTKALYVTRKLDGRLWIDSEVGKGTRVTIEVPVPAEVYHEI